MSTYATEQEEFWAGSFGDEYSSRNASAQLHASNLAFFSKILARTGRLATVTELGANIGMNLRALSHLLPEARFRAVEINPTACDALKRLPGVETIQGSLLDPLPGPASDLAFVKGVLIHIKPEKLQAAYANLAKASARWVLIAEYYNPSPAAIAYRGHTDRLFKRDFAGEFLVAHTQFLLVDYGFLYRHDPVFPQDDITWFLLERSGARS